MNAEDPKVKAIIREYRSELGRKGGEACSKLYKGTKWAKERASKASRSRRSFKGANSAVSAANRLNEALSGKSWFQSVGVTKENGKDALIVYMTDYPDNVHRRLRNEWEGYNVRMELVGEIRPT